MLRRTLNLGILAHVDAGKTTLTERLLYAAGVIDEIGSVDDGSTQTDFLALERQRGITIKSAVVSFAIEDVTVNLIDTPGHPDFIAEVERALSVLDGAVLVISAVEGVQAQTLVLMRALQRLGVPTLLFVNKIDRGGADAERVLRTISERLTPAAVAMGTVHDLGTREAGFTPWGKGDAAFAASLAEHDEALLAAFVNGDPVTDRRLREKLAAQTGRALVHPVFFGSAITGAGVESLRAGIAELLPAADGDGDGPVSGTVFKVERGPAGEKIAYVRMFSGTVRTRDRLRFGDDVERKVTAIHVFDRGDATRRASVSAGEIGKLWGLGEIRIGDADRHAAHERGAPLRPADAGDGRRPHRPRRQGRASHRARPARRAGPADRRAPGRRAAGDLRLALRRGAEGGHPGDARERLRPRRRLPRDDDDLRRAADRDRRRVRAGGRRWQPVRRDGGPAHRAGRGRYRARVPDRGRARVDAGGIPHGRRGHRARDAASGAVRLAGDGLRGHAHALRLPDGKLGRRLPPPRTARSDEGARAGGDGRVRADPPLPPRVPRRPARERPARLGRG